MNATRRISDGFLLGLVVLSLAAYLANSTLLQAFVRELFRLSAHW